MNKDYLQGWEDALSMMKNQAQVLTDMGDEDGLVGVLGSIKAFERWIEQYKEANK